MLEFSFGTFFCSRCLLMGRDGVALLVMLASVFWGSLIPVFLVLRGDLDGPFFFAASWRLGTGLSSLLGMLVYLRALAWRDRGVLLGAWRRLLCVPVILTAMGSLDYGLFLLSLRFISAPVATVLVEGHLLLFSCSVPRAATVTGCGCSSPCSSWASWEWPFWCRLNTAVFLPCWVELMGCCPCGDACLPSWVQLHLLPPTR